MSAGEEYLALQCRVVGLAEPEREWRFSPPRRWRFDFAWPEQRLAVEVEGGTFAGGRHTRGAGFAADCEKYNRAVMLGWRVLRVTTAMVADGRALAWVEGALALEGEAWKQNEAKWSLTSGSVTAAASGEGRCESGGSPSGRLTWNGRRCGKSGRGGG